MAGALQTEAYRRILNGAMKLRGVKGLSQADLAKLLGRPPSFVGKYELGGRRLDVVELFVIITALGADPVEYLKALELELPEKLA